MDAPQLMQYRKTGRHSLGDVRPHRDVYLEGISQGLERRWLARSDRGRPVVVAAAAAEDGDWLWTRGSQSSWCSVVTGLNASTLQPRRYTQRYVSLDP